MPAKRARPETPECEKLRNVSQESQRLGEFLDFLTDDMKLQFGQQRDTRWCCENCGIIPTEDLDTRRRGVRFNDIFSGRPAWEHRSCDGAVEYSPEGFYPVHTPKVELLARFFDIDLKKVEDERRSLLEWLQEAHEAP